MSQIPAGQFALDAAGAVACDLPCIGCGYNLRTRPAAGRCPECGRPVAETLGQSLQFADPAWLGRIVRGLWLLLLALAVSFAWQGLTTAISWIFQLSRAGTAANSSAIWVSRWLLGWWTYLAVDVVVLVVIIAGVYALTRVPVRGFDVVPRWSRRGLWLAVWMYGVIRSAWWVIFTVLASFGVFPRTLVNACAAALGMLWFVMEVVSVVSYATLLCSLLSRSSHFRLARLARVSRPLVVAWGVAFGLAALMGAPPFIAAMVFRLPFSSPLATALSAIAAGLRPLLWTVQGVLTIGAARALARVRQLAEQTQGYDATVQTAPSAATRNVTNSPDPPGAAT